MACLWTFGCAPQAAPGTRPGGGTVEAGVGIDASIGSPPGSDGGGGVAVRDASESDSGPVGEDPTTCAQAAASRSYVGCDFYPTAVANIVWPIYDYAVVVANTGAAAADVTVTGNGVDQHATVPPNGLQTIYLPWMQALKGTDWGMCGDSDVPTASMLVPHSAYHLTSSLPVTVYQFSPLEYEPTGGPPGKVWSTCAMPDPGEECTTAGCPSYSNDASLLLPSTAMTGHYRVEESKADAWVPSYVAITGTVDGTEVKIHVSPTGEVVAGGGVAAASAGGMVSLTLNQGDVAEVVEQTGQDLSGSLVQADHPVQVIAGNPCVTLPHGAASCDHMEEALFPVETLGKHYFVTPSTGPLGDTPGYDVRFYGNADGTHLTYPSGAPPGAPATIDAGQVVDLGQITAAFEVQADHELAVGIFMLGGQIDDPGGDEGDPSQSQAVAVEQYRTKYVFLAPTNYDSSYADVIMPSGAHVMLDGAPLTGASSPIGSGYVVMRPKLGPGAGGAHVLVSDQPVGLQVMGYGVTTSYQYPGGLNLHAIAPPPPLI